MIRYTKELFKNSRERYQRICQLRDLCSAKDNNHNSNTEKTDKITVKDDKDFEVQSL
jgi:hypothetical protein